jgi:hypothetical protein
MPKLQEKPSALKREHPVLKNMKNLDFFHFCGSYLSSWIRIRNLNADPDPATQINADPCGSGYGSETLFFLYICPEERVFRGFFQFQEYF